MALRQPFLPPLMGAVVGLVWFVRSHSVDSLDPTNVGWVLKGGDGETHMLAWLAFRGEPWQFPVGAFSSYLHPVGGTVALTDSMPWLAILFKTVSAWLPTAFQYIGPWLALCFMLQGAVGALLIRKVGGGPWCQALGGALFALSPTLLWRTGHETLCAHWLILLLLGLNLPGVERRATPKAALAVSLGAVVLSIGLQAYLTPMVWLLSVALVVRLWAWEAVIGPWVAGAFALGSAVVVLLLGWAFGFVAQGATLTEWGFGHFSADLLTFVNPMGASAVLPALRAGRGQYEGFAYLGLGALFLGGVALVAWLRSGRRSPRPAARHLPLLAVVALMTVFALATPVTLLGRPVLDLRDVYAPFAQVTSGLRSSGRFIWPLHYLLLLAVCAAVVRCLPRKPAIAALALAVLLQAWDVKPAQDATKSSRPPDAQIWSLGVGDYRHIVLYPPQVLWSARCLELGRYPEGYYAPLAYRAYLLGMTINSGYFSRGKLEAFTEACNQLAQQVARREFAADTIYVVDPSARPSFAVPGMICGKIDGYDVCVSSARPTALARLLTATTGKRPTADVAKGR
jgi:Family of unknown function (DUF6311)